MNFSLVTQIDMEAVAKPGRDEARPSHKCANNVPYGNFGRDGLCPVHKRTPPCVDAHRVQRVVCPFNDVERVEAPDGVRAMLGDAVRYPPRAVAGVRAEDADSQDRARRRRDERLERVRLGEHRRTRHAPVGVLRSHAAPACLVLRGVSPREGGSVHPMVQFIK